MNGLEQILFKKRQETDLFRQKQRHYGYANRDKTLYYIEEDNRNLGFFAMYRYWLEYLYFADVCGYTPVIYAGDQFAYGEGNKIGKTCNPFEYYFEQPAGIGLHEAKSSNKVILSDPVHRKMVELIFTGETNNYKYNKMYLYAMGQIVKKYLRFNKETEDYIRTGLKKIDITNNEILGVHARGTDFRAKYNNHPIYIEEENYFTYIDLFLEKHPNYQIFVATDDNNILKEFLKKYGEQIRFYDDVERSNNKQSVAFSNSSRKQHKYLLGLEVIRDMYTLSLCSGLIAGTSQVSICAQINKLARKERYANIRIIDKGLYRNSHHFIRF